MAKQKLTPKARADKKKRDLAFAKTFARKKKKAENQRLRRAAIKAGKNISGKDYDHKDKKFKSIKANRGNDGKGTKKEK
tara:strand:+ start:132 stop:368 length:237 start_codon:yes stop_codon:yes gene_type:complete